MEHTLRQSTEILLDAIRLVLGVSFDDMCSDKLGTKQCYARRIYACYIHEWDKSSHQEIAKTLNKDRSTISHAIKRFKVENNSKNNPEFKAIVDRVNEYCRQQ